MTLPAKKQRQKLFEELSKLKGSQASISRAVVIAATAGLPDNKALIKRSARLTADIIAVLKKAMPEVPGEVIGTVVAALTDLWEAGQKLDRDLKLVKKLRFPGDMDRLRDLLIGIKVHQLDEPAYWIGVISRKLPKLLNALDQEQGSARRLTPRGPNSSK